MREQVSRRLFLVTIAARPHEESSHFADVGGAYVSCWLDVESEQAAVAQAEAEVLKASWVPDSIETVVVVTREDYAEDDPSLQYFEQALLDKVVLVFQMWPNEPQEDDTIQ
jgi:hypothetical protein